MKPGKPLRRSALQRKTEMKRKAADASNLAQGRSLKRGEPLKRKARPATRPLPRQWSAVNLSRLSDEERT